MAKDSNKKIEEVDGVPVERQGARPDFSIPPPRKQLPKELQDTLNDEEKLWEVLYDGEYVHILSPTTHTTPSNAPLLPPSLYEMNIAHTPPEAKTQQTPPSAMPPTPHESAPSCSPPTAT
jgi:hypothetical protein